MESETFLYPPWREAAKRFLESGFKPGDIVTFEWLYDAFRIKYPDPRTMLAEEADKLRLLFLGQWEAFKDELLKNHYIDLTSERGHGYRYVPAADQTKDAYSDGVNDLRKAFRKLTNRITHVDFEKLTPDQRRENADTLAKVSMMRGMMKEKRQLPYVKDEE